MGGSVVLSTQNHKLRSTPLVNLSRRDGLNPTGGLSWELVEELEESEIKKSMVRRKSRTVKKSKILIR
jgi:hypothetical protein